MEQIEFSRFTICVVMKFNVSSLVSGVVRDDSVIDVFSSRSAGMASSVVFDLTREFTKMFDK